MSVVTRPENIEHCKRRRSEENLCLAAAYCLLACMWMCASLASFIVAAEIVVRDIVWEDDFNMGRAAYTAICNSYVMAVDLETPVIRRLHDHSQ